MDSFNDVLDAAKAYCREHTADATYQYYISGLKAVSFENSNCITLEVRNDFICKIVSDRYTGLLKDAFKAVLGFDVEVKFTVPQPEPEAAKEKRPMDEASLPSGRYDFTFENFIRGPSNQFAFAAAQAVAANPSGAYNPLFIYGPSGLGKTHLMYAIANVLRRTHPEYRIIYVKGEDFTNELITAIQEGNVQAFRNKYRMVDLLLLDDVQFIAGKERTQEEFFHTFNALYDARKQIVLTSDRPPKEIKTLEDRLRSRFEQDLIADIQPPDLETRIAIIKRKAELDGVEISDEVCEYVASKIKANIRQLEGTVKKIKAKYYLDGEKPTINSVQGIISDILNNDAPPEVTVERIIDEVARTYGVSADEIRSQKNRSANISNARHIAIYVTRELTTLSMVAIGEEFGNRHYSTIIYTIQKVQKMMEKDRKVKEIIDDTIKNIRDR